MQEVINFINYHIVIVITWFFLLILVLFNIFKNLTLKAKTISINEAIYLMNNNDIIVVDIRQYNDFCKGHIINAINLTPDKIKNNNIQDLNKYKNNSIIIIDYNGMQYTSLVRKLNKLGFKEIFIVKDGIYGFNKENIPLIRN